MTAIKDFLNRYLIAILLLSIGLIILFTQGGEIAKLVTADFKNLKFSGNIAALLIAASVYFFYALSQDKPEDILKYAEKKLNTSAIKLEKSVEKLKGEYATIYLTLGKGPEVPKIIMSYKNNELNGKYRITQHSKTLTEGNLEFYESTVRNKIVSIMSKIEHAPTLPDTMLKIELSDKKGNNWNSSMSTKIRIAEFNQE